MKHLKRSSSMILALALAFALSVPAFAAEAPAAAGTVTIVLQQKVKDAAPTAINIPVENKNTFTMNLSDLPANSTVYDVVNALPRLSTVAENPLGSGTPANCTWKQVDVLDPTTWLPTGEKAFALNSLAFKDARGAVLPANTYTSIVTESTAHTYKGWAWTYAVTTAAGTEEPVVYMDQCPISSDMTITLTYSYSEMSF